MDLSTGLPFWLVKNGLPYDYPQLAKNINCDVVILGGGITAAINAFILIEADIPLCSDRKNEHRTWQHHCHDRSPAIPARYAIKQIN